MTQDPHPSRVLVVEDSATQAQELQTALEADGYRVEVATDGRKALEALSAAGFDVVLSDIMMPNLSGYELCRAIKADPALRHIPFLLLTSLRDPQDVILGLECGADNFIRKPFEVTHLSARIHAAIATKVEGAGLRPGGGVDVNFINGFTGS